MLRKPYFKYVLHDYRKKGGMNIWKKSAEI